MTIPRKEMSKRELLHYLRRRADRWQFGIEVGANSGYEHYQVRYRTSNDDVRRERLYWTGIACELQQAGGWSNYELKDGNFYTSDDDELGKYRFGRLEDFQRRILKHIEHRDSRKITVLVDTFGARGKTFFSRWADLNGKAVYLEGCSTDSDAARDLYDIAEDRIIRRVIIDCTRSDSKMGKEFWTGIELIKNGHLTDRRYGYRCKWIHPPAVLVLLNKEPDWKALSGDRWDRIFLTKTEMIEYPEWKSENPPTRIRLPEKYWRDKP